MAEELPMGKEKMIPKEKMVPVEEPQPVNYRDLDRVRDVLTAVDVELMRLRFDNRVLLHCAQLMTVRADGLAGALQAVAPDHALAKKLIASTSAIHKFNDQETRWILENVTRPAEELAAAFPKLMVRSAQEGSFPSE
jgi:hypothetical protein